MMTKIINIKQMVKDGSYFKDGMQWYLSKYIFAFTLRSSVLTIFIIMLIGMVSSINTARKSFAGMQIPFPIYAKDEVNYFPIIKPLAYKTDSIEKSVARYFVSKYVELREGYNPFDFNKDNKEITFNKIKALSSHYTYHQYQDFFDTDKNSDSPIIKYKNQTKRLIKINSVTINSSDNLPESALINFTATEKSKGVSVNENYNAEISFMMSDISKVYEKYVPLYFAVVKYKTYKLSK